MSGPFLPADFQTTCWTQVNDAARHGKTSEPMAQKALESLCRRYWYPLYAYLRHSGFDADCAEDYVQGFFADFLARESLKSADPDRGRFRSFLLSACKNYVANQQRAERAKRRGGGRIRFSLDTSESEKRYFAEPIIVDDAEKMFERRWALETIEAALATLQARYREAGKEERFLILRPLIAPAGAPPTHAELAERLSTSEGAVKVAAHRLRQQFAAALRDQVAATVDLSIGRDSQRQSVDDELTELLAALQS